MARTIESIRNELLATKEAESGLDILSSTSKLSIWRLLINVVAVCTWVLENLFDSHVAEVKRIISNTRPLYIPQLVTLIKEFQFGHELVENEVFYNNEEIDESIVEASKVVKHCAINELRRGLRIKVAGENELGEMLPLPIEQYEALFEYVKKIRPFVPFKLTNQSADQLYLNLKIYYNPLVLNSEGKRLDGMDDTPVNNAVYSHLKNIEFNGRFVLATLLDTLQNVDGVTIPHCVSAFAQYADTDLLPISIYYMPDAGYLQVAELNIEYIADEHF